MKRIRIYLDTSVVSFLHADDAPEKKEATIDFFENYAKPLRMTTPLEVIYENPT